LPPTRRLWCSCTIIYYLAGYPAAKPECDLIIEEAERGETEIVVSVLSEAEVVKLDKELDTDAELMIEEFFGRSYIIRAALEPQTAKKARALVRRYPGIKPLDAVHIATALQHDVPILETYDNGMIAISGKEGNPPLIIRQPTYEGKRPLFQMPASRADESAPE